MSVLFIAVPSCSKRASEAVWKAEIETVNGVKAKGGSINGPGATIVGGMVYLTSGYGSFGQLAGNVVLAFGVP